MEKESFSIKNISENIHQFKPCKKRNELKNVLKVA